MSKRVKKKQTRTFNKRNAAQKRLLILTLGASLLAQPLTIAVPAAVSAESDVQSSAAAQSVQQQLVAVYEEMITAGAKRVDYQWKNKIGEGAQLSNVHVIEVDLTNPNVKLDVMNGKTGAITGYGSTGSMVKNSGAVAGVNADYFNTAGKGVPMGAEVQGGTLVASPSLLKGMYAFAVTKDRKPLIDLFSFNGTITAADGATFPLAGINKAAYMTEPDNGYSHANAMYIYTSAWTAPRPDAKDSSTTPTEVLVQNGIVMQIADNSMIPGTPPADGYILRTHGKAADFVRAHLQVGQQISSSYALVSQTTGQTFQQDQLQMLVGGHTILVDQGKAAAFSRDVSGISPSGDRARTAVGYNQDGTKVMIVTVEDSDNSKGVNLAELQQLLVQLGVWRAVNLDGGGSTTMVTRPLGEFDAELTAPTEYGTVQRLVPSGLGVYTTAPQGELKGIKASGSGALFIGQQAAYEMKAYDTYYNPVDPGSLTPTWKIADALGTISGNTFTAAKAGTTTLTVKSGSVSDELPIEVIGGAQIAQMTIEADSPVLEQGKTLSVPVSVVLEDGRKMTIPASSLKWEMHGFTGTMQGDSLTIGSVTPGAAAGYLIARYDGFSTVAVLATGTDKKFENFDKVTYPITFSGTNGVSGTVGLVSGLSDDAASNALQLSYDFTGGSGTKAAYAALDGSGRNVEGSPSAITMDVLGDNSLNWLRAEFIDKAGKSHLVTLADQIDWTGWKQLKVNLPSDKMTYPLKLKRIYVASIADGQDERAISGSVAFDNISFQYPAAVAEPARTAIQLKIGSKWAKVGGQATKMDVAPLLLGGTTYLPLRFVTEAMGAEVDWEQTAKRVTVLRGSKLLEMWLGRQEFIVNGIRMKSEIAPITRGGRTLVPIRLVSEQLGLTVNWDGKLGTISVE
ncbi:phosphodiester glycosidase family protein [Paenibacillus sp. sptzw28]|uniref:stalk domain-containing protein n=1 Tax=Paenibacillus sp. sptzw28 TaxID=715179 RepID=UPI001C6E1BF2|nr:stalk domain-containing protein [Paenibacillus sp. sptzw28]QYR22098.1 phosphodiester glycosidase family protein [Paenibacillus sp. sptzw28]